MIKPILLDGAFGTCLWAEAEKQNIEKKSTWRYNTEDPELLESIISAYEKAGSEIIYSNTFVATRAMLEAEHAADRLRDTIVSGMRAVRNASDAKLAYSVGPLPGLMEPYGMITEKQVEDNYKEAIGIAAAEDPDMIILETFTDLNMLDIAASLAAETKLPLICSMSFNEKGRTLLGDSISDMIGRLEKYNLSGIGMNCSVGPESAVNIIREFSEKTKLPLLVKPNSAELNARDFARALKPCLDKVSYAGACCGSNPDYIAELRNIL